MALEKNLVIQKEQDTQEPNSIQGFLKGGPQYSFSKIYHNNHVDEVSISMFTDDKKYVRLFFEVTRKDPTLTCRLGSYLSKQVSNNSHINITGFIEKNGSYIMNVEHKCWN